MKKTINLYKGCGKFVDGKSIFLTSEDLELIFEGCQNGTDYYIVLKNGSRELKLKLENGKCTITNNILKSGVLRAKVVGYVGDEKICEHTIEDLLIKELDGKIEAIPQVEDLICKVEKFTKKVDNFVEIVEKAMKMLKVLCDIDIEIGG